MKKRKIFNWNEVIEKIKTHYLFELRFLFSELKKFKKRRKRFYFSCYFHEDKHPSCDYIFSNGIFYCFGCGRRGSIISYYMLRREVDFHQAVIELAKIFKIKIEWGYSDDFSDDCFQEESSLEDHSNNCPYDDVPF